MFFAMNVFLRFSAWVRRQSAEKGARRRENGSERRRLSEGIEAQQFGVNRTETEPIPICIVRRILWCRTRVRMACAACDSSRSTATMPTAPWARPLAAAGRIKCGPPADAEASSHVARQGERFSALAHGTAASSAPASHATRCRAIAGMVVVHMACIAAMTMAPCSLTAIGMWPHQRMWTMQAVEGNVLALPGARTCPSLTRRPRVPTT